MRLGRAIIRFSAWLDAHPCRCAASPALARWLTAEGHEATHVGDLGMHAASDNAIWNYALASDCVIVTKDEDFAQRKVLDDNGPPVIWIRLPNTRRRELLAWFETMLPHIVAALDRGDTLIEVV